MRLLALFSVLLFSSLQAAEDVSRYEAHLNKIKTLSGTFTQTSSGNAVTGQIQISRPGKMRLDYHPPAKLLIVSDGKWVMTYDKELDEKNYVSLENTPAAFILKPHVVFNDKEVAVTNIVRADNRTEISLIRRSDPDAGYITLIFQEAPLALKEWSVSDAQGIETRVELQNMVENKSLDKGLFVFESPNWAQQVF